MLATSPIAVLHALERILDLNPLLSYQSSLPLDNEIHIKILLLNSRIQLKISLDPHSPIQSDLDIHHASAWVSLLRQPNLLTARHRTAQELLRQENSTLPSTQTIQEPLRQLQKILQIPDHIRIPLFEQLRLLSLLSL